MGAPGTEEMLCGNSLFERHPGALTVAPSMTTLTLHPDPSKRESIRWQMTICAADAAQVRILTTACTFAARFEVVFVGQRSMPIDMSSHRLWWSASSLFFRRGYMTRIVSSPRASFLSSPSAAAAASSVLRAIVRLEHDGWLSGSFQYRR
mmetsp:Transcript_15010/g.45823  ORF Transcript_15010/g.45823 Transcript_15010/m.45823 type:complete len:150 (-) Transcript_15010:1388-1837(-)